MFVTRDYDRMKAVLYAEKYAFSQNALFGDFRDIGGNCTNFVSQCVFAGSCQMNYTPTFGWYYISLEERAPAWTGVQFFYNFLTSNKGIGPFGRECTAEECEIGDIIQLGREDDGFYHSLLIIGFDADTPLVAAQTDDAYARPLSSYTYDYARYVKIDGVRIDVADVADCFDSVYNGIAIVPTGDAE